MKNSNKILLVGPVLPPVNGQSLAFTRFLENIDQYDITVINTSYTGRLKLVKFFNSILIIIKIILFLLFFRYKTVYFTCSRSLFGSVKDLFLINIASIRRARIVNHLHGSDFYEFIHGTPDFYKKLIFNAYNKVTTSIVLADAMKEQFIDFSQMNIEVVNNFYDVELEDKYRNYAKGISHDNSVKLLYLSNIMSSKGIFYLLDAFDFLSKKYANLTLEIAGSFLGDDSMCVDDVIRLFNDKVSKNKRIKYRGTIFGEQKYDLLYSTDIFVLPTYYKSEALPISIIEAMISGNAIITTNYKYLPDLVKEQNGILVEPKDLEQLVSAIESLIINQDRLASIKKFNENEAREKYCFDTYINNLRRIVCCD